jgi:hypothetical protein
MTGLANVKLRFWSKLDSFESGDKALVKVSGDGTNWGTLREFVDGEDTNIYHFHELDVPNLGNTLYVRFDAQMNQSTDNWYIDDIKLVGTTNAQPVEMVPNKFFVVDDGSTDRTFGYNDTGAWIGDPTLAAGNITPRGAVSTAAGTRVWVVDQNRNVYVYDNWGQLQGLWSAGSLTPSASVQGIATDGTDVWIVDSSADGVYRYASAASRLSGSQNPATSFALNKSNKNPKDVVTDGTHLWVVEDATTDKVFKYTLSGSLVGSWTINSGGGSPTGITLDLANNSDLWIVDSATDRVYQYAGAASRTSGSQSAATFFPLAAGNTNPQGIADPPTGGSASSFADLNPIKLGIQAGAALARSVAATNAAPRSSDVSGSRKVWAVDNGSGNTVVFGGIAVAPPAAVPFALKPVRSPANESFAAIDDLMAEFGEKAFSKSWNGVTLNLDTALEGLFATI